MTTPKVMRLVDASTGVMECKVCGVRHSAVILPDGKFRRGSWQCRNGCRDAEADAKEAERVRLSNLRYLR